MRKLLTRSIRQVLVIGLALFSMSCESPEAAQGYTVRGGHPRIWLTPVVLERLRSSAASGSPRWQALKRVCDTYISSRSRSSVSVMNYALAYQVSGNPAYAEKAIALAQETVDKGMPAIFAMGKYGYSVRDVLPEVALCYDWCYDRLSPEQRRRFREQLEAWSDWVWPETNPERATGWAVRNPGNNFYQGFMMTWLVGLALHGDSPKAEGYLSRARKRFHEQVRPYLETYGQGGYLLEGTNYGTGSRIFWYLSAHSTATDEDLLGAQGFDWARDATLCRLHITTPTRDRVYPGGAQARDAKAPISDYMRGTALVATSYLDPVTAGYAKWWLDNVKPGRNIWRFTQWEEFLWYRDDVTAIDYTRVLPTGYRAPGSGLMISRSSWDTDAVQVVMVCGPTRESHQDMAQNGFVIFRGDWLAGMARLKAHGGLKRDTESHNALTIGGAGQVGEQDGARVIHFIDTPRYAYMAGDARDVYDPPKYKGTVNVLDEFRRELLFLKPGVVMVFDRVKAVDGQKEKKWHLQSMDEPVIGEGSYQTTAGGSVLFGTRVLPREAVVQKLPLHFGREKALSSWRIDIAAPVGQKVDHFLNVLEVAPAARTAPTPVAALVTGRDSLMGAQIGSQAVLFDVGTSPVQPVVYQAGPGVREHFVLNQEPEQWYRLTEVELKSGRWYQVTREASPNRPGRGQVARASKEGIVYFGLEGKTGMGRWRRSATAEPISGRGESHRLARQESPCHGSLASLASGERMKVLVITNLFPNRREPNRGCFNLQQFAALRRHADLRVVAPIAWQPWICGWARPAPFEETWDGIPTYHPLYYYTPGMGRAAYSAFMYGSLRGTVTRLVQSWQPDVLLATWAYPDAVAGAALARQFGLPWVAKVHGSDINVIARAPLPRRQVRWALRRAACTFAVSRALKEQLVTIGVPADRVRVQHNGVNVGRFRLQEKTAAREVVGLPLDRRIVVYVGNLKTSKGVLDLVEAARQMAASRQEVPLVVLVGGGPARDEATAAVERHGLEKHVRLVGPRPHGEIADWIAAGDTLCLPSHNEGCPNVVLEALACGRPVVASGVGAVPDLIDATCGAVVPPREPGRLADALRAVPFAEWDPMALRERVLPLSWEENARVLAEELACAAGLREWVSGSEEMPTVWAEGTKVEGLAGRR